ncbi:tyrosine-type recombinase/integrase [Pyramidobacter sp. C12-8]|uniref:tyrosine-type recombinase/integrase n=1 Tax=Pyramidobacter sp. C12-8 TaxID=1943580 RepID=UPI00098F80DE|nr:integrase arm-type DNA-binding domain-containing protein [Pyramidobacter sp. C12-8]OON89692.1 hypothetical protein B0D78_02365 [Pyramidobacter sp. C12-8]
MPKDSQNIRLTDKSIKSLKPREKIYTVADGDCLYLVVHPTGLKVWQIRTRRGDGRNHKKVLGKYPALTLAQARERRDWELLNMDQSGTMERMTYQDLSEFYLDHISLDRSEPYVLKLRHRQENYMYPKLGLRLADTITPPDLMDCYTPIAKKYRSLARRIASFNARMYAYGIVMRKVRTNPALMIAENLPEPLPKQHYATLTEEQDIAAFWRNISNKPMVGADALIRFQTLTLVRPSEARRAKWSEIDLAKKIWIVPLMRMKKRREHIVPLSRQAIEILEAVAKYYPARKGLVFPGRRRFLSAQTLLSHIEACTDGLVAHGLRAMASTTLYRLKFVGTWIELQLSHIDPDQTRDSYRHYDYLPERRAMLQWYADYLDALRDGTPIPPKPDI